MSDPTAPQAGHAVSSDANALGSRGRIPRAFGRYRLLDCLGRGGMGAVFRAHDTQLDRTVALKVPFLGADETALRDRFLREARAAAALHHPNVCPVYDVGEFAGMPYLTMAFIEGPSLAAAMESGRAFTPKQAALLVRKVAQAMHAAHAVGVVHRDLKPANVLLRPDGEPVVTDFGLARRADDRGGEALTRPGDTLGTVEYMPPEQFDTDLGEVGPKSDVYSLGVVLYELLAGRRPFDGSPASVMAAVLFKPPPPPSAVRPGVPAGLEAICLRAMAKRPADRYPTMAAFADALAAFVRSAQGSGTAPPVGPSMAAETPPPRPETRPMRPAATADPGWEVVEEPPPPPRSAKRARLVKPRKKAKPSPFRPVVLGGAAFGAACLSLIVAAVIVKSGDQPAAPPPTAPAVEQAPPKVLPRTPATRPR
jgi:serine/threonine protein kinase